MNGLFVRSGGGLRTVLAHQFSLLSGTAAQRLSSAVIVALLCRALSAGEFGKYVFMMSLLDVAFVLIGFGSQIVVVRAIAQGADAGAVCRAAARFRLLTAGVVVPVFLAAMAVAGRDSLFGLALVMSIGLVAHVFAEVPLSVLQGRMFMGVKAAIDGLTGAAGAVFMAAALAAGFGLPGAAWAFSARRVLTLAAAEAAARVKTGAGLLRRGPGEYRGLARQAAPFGIGATAVVLYIRWSPILLFGFVSDGAAGLFGGAQQIFEVVTLAGTVMARAALPALAAAWASSRPEGEALAGRAAGVSLAAGAAAAWLVSTAAPWLVPFVFKSHFAAAAPVLRTLLAAAPLIFVYEILIHRLYAAHRQKAVLAVVAAGVFSALILNMALLPAFGLAGAAFASLLNEAAMFSAYALITGWKLCRKVVLGAALASAGLLLVAVCPGGVFAAAVSAAACGAAAAVGLAHAGRRAAPHRA